MRWSAVNRAAATSGRKARRLRAKPYATTPIIPTWPRGSSRAWANDPGCTRNPSSSRKCIRCSVRTSNEASPETKDEGPSEASLLDPRPSTAAAKPGLRGEKSSVSYTFWHASTARESDAFQPENLAPDGSGDVRAPCRLRRRLHIARHVVSRNAGRCQRGPRREGQGCDRVRLGLP